MRSPRLHIRTPSRLHFGLLGWGPQVRRQYGGVGLMIESPGVVLRAELAPAWQFKGPLARRVEQIAGELRERLRRVSCFAVDEVARLLEQLSRGRAEGPVVVDDQHALAHEAIVAQSARRASRAFPGSGSRLGGIGERIDG